MNPGKGVRPDGVLVVDKAKGPTSHDIVQRVRRILKVKAGHTGTLDPAATGVLPVVVGNATRLARFLQASDKEYLAWIRLGVTTDSYDSEGTVTSRSSVPELSRGRALQVLERFQGRIQQQPPLFSAVRVQGERLYKAARRGEQKEVPSREVTIYRLDLLVQQWDRWLLKIWCSSGTYVRSLAQELGKVLGCGACLEDLRRVASGPFRIKDSVSLESIESKWRTAFIPMEELLDGWARQELNEEEALRVSRGTEIPAGPEISEGHCRLFHHGRLLAIGECRRRRVQPRIVFPATDNSA